MNSRSALLGPPGVPPVAGVAPVGTPGACGPPGGKGCIGGYGAPIGPPSSGGKRSPPNPPGKPGIGPPDVSLAAIGIAPWSSAPCCCPRPGGPLAGRQVKLPLVGKFLGE